MPPGSGWSWKSKAREGSVPAPQVTTRQVKCTTTFVHLEEQGPYGHPTPCAQNRQPTPGAWSLLAAGSWGGRQAQNSATALTEFSQHLPLVSVSIWSESSIPKTLVLPLFCQLVGSFSGGTDSQRALLCLLHDMAQMISSDSWLSGTCRAPVWNYYLQIPGQGTDVHCMRGQPRGLSSWEGKAMFVYKGPQCTVRETAPQGARKRLPVARPRGVMRYNSTAWHPLRAVMEMFWICAVWLPHWPSSPLDVADVTEHLDFKLFKL